MNDPMVTVGIPSYNRPESLKKAINSVINQTYTNLEIIVSDNNSNGSEVEDLVKSYCEKDDRIIFNRHLRSIGSMENFKYLLKKANGEFFMWLADDDVISDNYISDIILEFKKKGDCSLIGGQGYFLEGEDCRKNESVNLSSNSPLERIYSYIKTVDSNSIFYGIYPKNLINFNYKYFYGWDWLHVTRLAILGKVETLNSAKIYRGTNGESNKKITFKRCIKIYNTITRNICREIKETNLFDGCSGYSFLQFKRIIKNIINERFVKVYIDAYKNHQVKCMKRSLYLCLIKILGNEQYDKLRRLINYIK